ncbi:hypothetical protein HOI27_08745 [bacterium]|jgi:hypothetical protein|nr:hypothetical protein [bacterium]
MFKLLDFNNQEISFKDLDNKAFWCAHGERQEKAFINLFNKLKEEKIINTDIIIEIHPEKISNPYHPDLLVNKNEIGDAKIKNSPLFMANKYSVSPQFALTIDLKDIFNYKKRLIELKQDVHIFVWVKWQAHKMITNYNSYEVKEMGGIWRCQISKIVDFLKTNHVGIHWYKEQYRQPSTFDNDSDWGKELINFEKRLIQNGIVKNITTKGFITKDNTSTRMPSGHSSCSYVLDLSNKDLFDQIYLNTVQ